MKNSRSVWKYRVLAIVAFLCTVGLCFVPTFFLYDYSFDFPKQTAFSVVKDFIASFSENSWDYLFPSWSLYPLFGAVVVSLVGLVVSLFSKKARGVFLTTVAINTFFLSAFAAIIRYHMGYEFVRSLYAAPTLLAIVSALLLVVGASLEKKGSAVKILSFVFASLSAVGVSHSVLSIEGLRFSGMGLHVFEKGLPEFFTLLGATEPMANVIAYGFTALLVVVALKYFVSIFMVSGKKTRVDVFSLIFNILQVALSVALYVLCFLQFKETFDTFGVYGLFAVLLFGILGIVFACIRKKVAPQPQQVTAADVDALMQLKLDDALPQTVEAPVEEKAETPVVEMEDKPVEGQITMEEAIVEAATPVEEKVEEVVAEETPAPVYPTVEIPVEQPVYTAPAQPTYVAPEQPAYVPPQAPYVAPYSAMPVPTMQGGNDFFYASLTPQERQQFDDLFIHCVLGENNRLPRYVVGGNNTEFFRKVFIFIGRYRAYISTSLLEKLYTHASRA